jgi:hypothetical protein
MNSTNIVQATNSKRPAFARPASEFTKSGTLAEGNDAIDAQAGLTKREFAAIQVFAAMLASPTDCFTGSKEEIASHAVAYTDALFDALDK